LPGGMIGPTTSTTIGVAISEATSQIRPKRRAWFGSGGAGCSVAISTECPGLWELGGPSLPDVQEAVHVAERLHRPAVAVDPAGRARDEALPAVAPLCSRAERERDRAMRLRGRARR